MSWAERTYAVILAGVALWCGGFLLAPACVASGSPALSAVGGALYALYHPVCHQMESHSLHLMGLPLAVCCRCSFIYFGFLAATVFFPFLENLRRPRTLHPSLVVIALVPMLVDVGLGLIGLHQATLTTRALTGFWFGVLTPFLLIPAAIEGICALQGERLPPSIISEKGLNDA